MYNFNLFANKIVTKMKKNVQRTVYLSSSQMPKSYQNNLTAQIIWRNLSKLINYAFQGSFPNFRKSLKAAMEENLSLSDKEANLKVEALRTSFLGYSNKRLSISQASTITTALKLPDDALLSPIYTKEVAYVFVTCSPKDSQLLVEQLKEEKSEIAQIIDEISTVTGDADIFIRLYGTREQIKTFLINELCKHKHINIQRTTTHFSFKGETWERYPNQSHQKRIASRPDWLPEKWSLEEIASGYM